jgi:hypothetical protein
VSDQQITNLTNLAARVNSNTLTASDQAAILTAISVATANWIDVPANGQGTIAGGAAPQEFGSEGQGAAGPIGQAWFAVLAGVALGDL